MTVRLPDPSPLSRIDAAAADVGSYTYGYGHLMKPQRMRITHELVSAYGMLDKMHVLVTYLLPLSTSLTRHPALASETRICRDYDALPHR